MLGPGLVRNNAFMKPWKETKIVIPIYASDFFFISRSGCYLRIGQHVFVFHAEKLSSCIRLLLELCM